MYQYFIGSALISNMVFHLSNMLITNCSVLSIPPVFYYYYYYANELVTTFHLPSSTYILFRFAAKDGVSA